MKNFSDLQAISTELRLDIALVPIVDNGAPWVQVRINDTVLYQDWLKLAWTHVVALDSLEPIDIQIEMRHKQYDRERETAVVIQKLCVAGFHIAPDHCYHASYVHDHDWCQASEYLGFNGVWRWCSQTPFFEWRHRVSNQGWLLTPARA